MKGSETKFISFIEGADKRYVIPVYQRKYDWKYDNCKQLYEDLKKTIQGNKSSHFFGSIVSNVVPDGSKVEYHIIDGQQRLTTVMLLLLAMRNLVAAGILKTEQENLDKQINDRFLISPWAKVDDRIKLRPVKDDRDALLRLFGSEDDYDQSSNLTINYRYFYETLQKGEISVDDVFNAVNCLEIISITLDHDDDAQLIFESLNSTGLALTEGDKIRNYVLMGLSPDLQEDIYENYWTKIEKSTKGDVSSFVRDYLSVKQLTTPNIAGVYSAFKTYVEKKELPVKELMADLLEYAKLYNKLLVSKSGLNNQVLDDCLYRMTRLEIAVTRPFLLEVLRLNKEGKIPTEDVTHIFLITENYLFRRNICDVPTNALNKIFLTLNREIIRYESSTDNYLSKFVYALLSKRESGRFPNDEEFIAALSTKAVYQMRGKYKAYLFERFENYGTVETKDVYTHLDNNTYTIEHIMPQHLSAAWVEELGPKYEEIHEVWLHRLANLTLTGYNPSLSNKSFAEKRDADKTGYKTSGLRMNQKIANKLKWGEEELKERNDEMISLALQIWNYPITDFAPAEKEYDSCTLDDESVELKGRDIVKYSFQGAEQPVSSWVEMYEQVIGMLHAKDKSVLLNIVYNHDGENELSAYVSNDESTLRSAILLDKELYIEKNNNTESKVGVLRRLFALYKVDPMDLVFYLKDAVEEKVPEGGRQELRKRYWEYALPMIQEHNAHRGSFSNVHAGTSNYLSGFFGIGGFNVSCVANYDGARVDFYMGSRKKDVNKAAFDKLFSHRSDIEKELGIALNWQRGDDNKASWIIYSLPGVSITNEYDWERMAKFHAEWSDKMCNALLPYLEYLTH